MGLWGRIGGVLTGEPVHSGRNGAVAPPVRTVLGVREEQTRDDDRGWGVVLSPRATVGTVHDERDWRELLGEAYTAYATNPLAYSVIEQSVNFILGGGCRVAARDPRVQRWLDAFWRDEDNAMDLRIYQIVTELLLFGEQFVRYFVDDLTGRVVVRQLDPLAVTAIETHPDDVERRLRYRYQPATTDVASAGAVEGVWLDASEVDHFRVNHVSNSLRGRSDLAPLLPWLRRYRDWLTDRCRQNRYKGAFLYDVTITGGDKGALDRVRAEYAEKPPESGSVLFHNEAEEWKAVQPQIGAGDVRDDGRALRLMVAVGAGLPEHYLSEGGNANRATAAEMGLPTLKRMQRRQEYVRWCVDRLTGRVIEAGIRAGRLGPRIDRSRRVEFEELNPSASPAHSEALERVTNALEKAVGLGFADQSEARRLWWQFAGEPERGHSAVSESEGDW